MKIHISSKQLGLTPSIKTYVESKLGPLGKLFKEMDDFGAIEMLVELGRVTRHHEHGNVFRAAASVIIKKKTIMAEAVANDIREAVDVLKGKLRIELERHKDKKAGARRLLRRGK